MDVHKAQRHGKGNHPRPRRVSQRPEEIESIDDPIYDPINGVFRMRVEGILRLT